MDARKKALIAMGLMALWGGVAYWQWNVLPDQAHIPLINTSGPASSLAQPASRTGGLRVHLEQLASARTQREATFTAPRNIFSASGLDGTSAAAGGGSDRDQQISEQAVQQQTASPELDQYRYLGFVRMDEAFKGTGNTAVLSKNEDVMIGRVGQHLERHLVVKAITPENVTLRDTQTHVDHTVPITEDAEESQP